MITTELNGHETLLTTLERASKRTMDGRLNDQQRRSVLAALDRIREAEGVSYNWLARVAKIQMHAPPRFHRHGALPPVPPEPHRVFPALAVD
jgi:hypothetical protein